MDGTVYLIHFDKKYYHAQHYIGWASNLKRRVKHHRNGTGSKLLAHLNKVGIAWNVVWSKPGTGNDERRMKQWKKARSFCPVCKKNE
jgi:predicted GIY-YIG superfamily endonuclease